MLAAGNKLGPYEIISPLGAGGMGEVYKAKDSRLDRTVAIKVLPAGSTANEDLRQRFEREAKAVSSLNHPNICILYDVGHQDGTDYLVMEHIEGETLSVRLEKGPLSTAELLRYATQIADALDKAHRQGLVHRDLKPGNIMLTKSGAKLLDFGLAKLREAGGVVQGVTGVTRTTPLTGAGTIIGTLQYMSPEQLEGSEADSRSDIFAFGCVLYEMATGRRAFEGKSQASLIAAIMGKEPAPVSSVSTVAPPELDRMVSRCIAKDPDDRWQTARDLMHELQWIASSSSQIGMAAPAVTRRKSRERWAWIAAAVFLLSTIVAGVVPFVKASREAPMVSSAILSPPGTRFLSEGGGHMSLSPDGLVLAFVATDSATGKSGLWVRRLSSASALQLPGAEGADYPFWSPDGRFIGFFADGKLKKIQATGGPALTICASQSGRGASWNREGVIVVSPAYTDVLYRVSAAGGTPVALTSRDSSRHDFTHRWPWFLPDGKHFLYYARTGGEAGSEEDAICVGSLDGGIGKRLVPAKSDMAYTNGHLLYMRENTLFAQRFDDNALEVSGDPIPIAQGVSYETSFNRGVFSVSQNGVLVYQEGEIDAGGRLFVFDREGRKVDSIGSSEKYFSPDLSPDMKQIAVDVRDRATPNEDIWIYELERGIRTRFTFDSTSDLAPDWSPDGSMLAWVSHRGKTPALFVKRADGVGEETEIASAPPGGTLWTSCWSPDGRFVLYHVADSAGGLEVWYASAEGGKQATALLSGKFAAWDAQLSPDGRWCAYVSDESGKEEVYVTAFPNPGGKWQVSVAEGDRPRWRSDGKELFYLDNTDKLMSAEVDGSGTSFRVGAVRPLFQTSPMRPGGLYDCWPDGQKFVVNTRKPSTAFSALMLVVNWPAELEEK